MLNVNDENISTLCLGHFHTSNLRRYKEPNERIIYPIIKIHQSIKYSHNTILLLFLSMWSHFLAKRKVRHLQTSESR